MWCVIRFGCHHDPICSYFATFQKIVDLCGSFRPGYWAWNEAFVSAIRSVRVYLLTMQARSRAENCRGPAILTPNGRKDDLESPRNDHYPSRPILRARNADLNGSHSKWLRFVTSTEKVVFFPKMVLGKFDYWLQLNNMHFWATRKLIVMGAVNQESSFKAVTYMTSSCAIYRHHVTKSTNKNDNNLA